MQQSSQQILITDRLQSQQPKTLSTSSVSLCGVFVALSLHSPTIHDVAFHELKQKLLALVGGALLRGAGRHSSLKLSYSSCVMGTEW